MDNYWVRPTGVYAKGVWLRKGVLQVFYDDDNNHLRFFSGPSVPGGHAAFTRTAVVYSTTIIDEAMTTTAATSEIEELRKQVPAFTQRVGSCYLVEAGILGFSKPEAASVEEQSVLSTSCAWAVADYTARVGTLPEQIVLHLDVNGSLSLGDVAGNKNFGKMASELSAHIVKRAEGGEVVLPEATKAALERAQALDEDALRQEFTTTYNGQDLVRTIEYCRSKTPGKPLTLAIRTNGVEFEAASANIAGLLETRMGLKLSEEAGNLTKYVATHEDKVRGLYFHPVLLEKMAKSKEYKLPRYVEELDSICGRSTQMEAWRAVSESGLKKSDPKFKLYLGLCAGADDKPGDHATNPPKLDIVFARESWSTPGSNIDEYKILYPIQAGASGPWWAGFGDDSGMFTAVLNEVGAFFVFVGDQIFGIWDRLRLRLR